MSGIKEAFLGDTLERDYVPPFQSHSATSKRAAHSIKKHIGPLHQRVLDYLNAHPEGATDEQLSDALQLNGSTLRPRRLELFEAGRIIKHPTREGRTKAGNSAVLWILKPKPDQAAPSRWWQHD